MRPFTSILVGVATSLSLVVGTGWGDESEAPSTRFLVPTEKRFEARFEAGEEAPKKPLWMLRKSTWLQTEDGRLRGENAGGNGAFIRLQSEENGGVLPEDYILSFAFMVEEDPAAEHGKGKYHPVRSLGHRFSFGHYAAKFQWRPDVGMDLNIGHGDALEDASFFIEKGKWYRVTAEIRGDEILVWFENGPAYYLKHDHFRAKPAGWEFFVNQKEIGYLDDLAVWLHDGQETETWSDFKKRIAEQGKAFSSEQHPDFRIEKAK